MHKNRWIVRSLAMLATLIVGAGVGSAQSFGDGARECQDVAAAALRVGRSDVRVRGGGSRLSWEADVAGRILTGGCDYDSRTGIIVRFDVREGGSSGFDSSGRGGGFFDDSRGGGRGGFGAVGNYPRVEVDTKGRGIFYSRSDGNEQLERGYVNTKDGISIGFEGDDVRITFYGEIVGTDGRGFSMRITGSDRGAATGTAQFRLNSDQNEVEMITARGRLSGQDFDGNFTRED